MPYVMPLLDYGIPSFRNFTQSKFDGSILGWGLTKNVRKWSRDSGKKPREGLYWGRHLHWRICGIIYQDMTRLYFKIYVSLFIVVDHDHNLWIWNICKTHITEITYYTECCRSWQPVNLSRQARILPFLILYVIPYSPLTMRLCVR